MQVTKNSTNTVNEKQRKIHQLMRAPAGVIPKGGNSKEKWCELKCHICGTKNAGLTEED